MKQRTRYLLILALLIFVMLSSAGCDERGEKLTEIEAAVSYVAAETFVPEFSETRMIDTITWLASKDNARISGLEGEAAAADYLVTQFSALGLEVSMQTFPCKSYVCDFLELKLKTDTERIVKEVKQLSFSAATPVGGIIADVAAASRGAEWDYAGLDVKGKVVVIQRGGEPFFVKTARAAEKGAVAVLFYDPNSEGTMSATLTELSKIPAVSITRDDGMALEAAAQSGETVTVALKLEVTHEDSTSRNVIALYKSPDNPEGKRIVVGAHYDGVDTPAANDNASGTAVILELAKVLSDQKIALPYDVEFIAFGAEEIGLIGSKFHVENMSIEERDKVIAMLNFDMVGIGDIFDIGYAEGFPAPNLIKMTRETLKEIGYLPTMSANSRSDHAPFAQAGMDAIYLQVGPTDNYHTDQDTVDMIQPELLVDVCVLAAKLIVEKLPELMTSNQ